MNTWEIIYLTVYLVAVLAISLFLFKKYSFFQKARGFLALLTAGIASAIVHNLLYGLIFLGSGKDEAVFFVIALVLLGAAISLFCFWLVKTAKRKWLATIFLLLLAGLAIFWFFYGERILFKVIPVEQGMASCQSLCGDNACQEMTCQALDCPCAETAQSCPVDCK